MFLVFDMCKNDNRISKIKLETIRELKAIFEAEPEQTTIMLNIISDELNREFQNLPHLQFIFLKNIIIYAQTNKLIFIFKIRPFKNRCKKY